MEKTKDFLKFKAKQSFISIIRISKPNTEHAPLTDAATIQEF